MTLKDDKNKNSGSAGTGVVWLDEPKDVGYYWVLYNNRSTLDIGMTFRQTEGGELQVMILTATSSPSMGYKPPFPSTCVALKKAKWLKITEPSPEDTKMFKDELERELKQAKLASLALEIQQLKEELGEK